ncbi:MAG: 2-C-methyl-D-erythritol 2,4-cyclodiphosphate synthase [Gammaproteobacteria bacterium]|jgi:2-C-methyl-D-erythritol 2,4-cyclodiphosphate synthase
MRIGHGFDAHRYGDGDGIVVGAVRIPHVRGIVAHSDGDVLIHALCDALLGALGLGDIGGRFPDTDERFRDANSRDLLRDVVTELHATGWVIENSDATIVAQAPRMSAHIPVMRQRLASDLGISVDCVNVKATTTERMGYIGRDEGLACHAVVLLRRA